MTTKNDDVRKARERKNGISKAVEIVNYNRRLERDNFLFCESRVMFFPERPGIAEDIWLEECFLFKIWVYRSG